IAFFVYFIASLASNKRAPFDLPESESELVAGFHTEYSGLRWSFFFFAEYGAMFIVGGIQAALFLGGWHDPFGLLGYWYPQALANFNADPTGMNVGALLLLNVIGCSIFVAKALGIIFVQMWLRWTLPRPRIDQVLYACIKVLLPLACALLLGAAVWQWLIPERSGIPWVDYQPWNLVAWFREGFGATAVTQVVLALVGISGFSAVIGWIAYSAVTGRGHKQRLTDPAPLDRVPDNLVKA
ncbi:MAG TPA: complex I subunit 1 family protein, partial [Tepidisphaeraceae bacterium]